jgi:hypothetical protein
MSTTIGSELSWRGLALGLQRWQVRFALTGGAVPIIIMHTQPLNQLQGPPAVNVRRAFAPNGPERRSESCASGYRLWP